MDASLRILPVTKPPVVTYSHHTHLLSVLYSHKEPLPWIFSNYIQIFIFRSFGSGKFGWGDFYFPQLMHPYCFCPFINEQKLRYDMVASKWPSITDFIIDSLNNNYYVNLILSTYFIPLSPNYKKGHFKHDYFIYGYDLEKQVFYCADFFDFMNYEHRPLSFRDVDAAYISCDEDTTLDYMECVRLIGYTGGDVCKLDIDKTVGAIEEYLLLSKTGDMYNSAEVAYGIEYYDVLRECLRTQNERDFFEIDIRPFHLLNEHKRFMQERLRFLFERGYIGESDYSRLFDEFGEIQKWTLALRNRVIKSNTSGKANLFDSSSELLEKIRDKETSAMKTLLHAL